MSSGVDALITTSIQESIKVKQALLEDKHLLSQIADVVKEFVSALSHGHKILLFGNGGSAADAQHIAAEFVGRFQMERTPLPALALTVNTSALTGIGNDYAYENVFSRQIEALGSSRRCGRGILHERKVPQRFEGAGRGKGQGIGHRGFNRKIRKHVAGGFTLLPLRALGSDSAHSGIPHPDRPHHFADHGNGTLRQVSAGERWKNRGQEPRFRRG